uniref:SH3 domain-containing protein n=1 Tax=Rhabditophanes sp. KR3021 TaxID=114890 RepID=A0AC35TPU8_9BILA
MKPGSIAPPPIAPKPRNESLGASLSTYRNRPSGNHFAEARKMFDHISQPQNRQAVINAVKSPFVQKTVIAAAKNDAVKQEISSAAKDEKFKRQIADILKNFDKKTLSPSSTTDNYQSNFNGNDFNGYSNNNANNSNNYRAASTTPMSQQPRMDMFSGSKTPLPYNNYNNTNKYNNYQQAPQTLPKPVNNENSNSNYSINDLLFGDFTPAQKQAAPQRPPPPAVVKNTHVLPTSATYPSSMNGYAQQPISNQEYSNSFYQHYQDPVQLGQHQSYTKDEFMSSLNDDFNPYTLAKKGPGLSDLEKSFSPKPSKITEPHGVAIYPYKANAADELSCEVDDIIFLKKEIDDAWIHGTNNRTNQEGIVPSNYLEIKIPLASDSPMLTSGYNSQYSVSPAPHQYSPSKGNVNPSNIVATAVYDYDSGIEGDLKFCAGDMILVAERASPEWLRGQFNREFGIFPVSYVKVDDLQAIPYAFDAVIEPVQSTQTTCVEEFVIGLYDYDSGSKDDLVFKEGDRITIIKNIDENWIQGSLEGKIGLVPMTYAKKV